MVKNKNTPKNEDVNEELKFNENPNLGNVIKMLESKHHLDEIEEYPNKDQRANSKNEAVRSRKFKKAMNSLGAR